MPDVFSKEKRSEIMSKIRAKDTKPEMMVRRALHSRGYRYKLHDKQLPGKPDLVLSKYKMVIQVRGCFWHNHGCKYGHLPKSNTRYWKPKLKRNKQRDEINDKALTVLGWTVIVVWECQCRNPEAFESTIQSIICLSN